MTIFYGNAITVSRYSQAVKLILILLALLASAATRGAPPKPSNASREILAELGKITGLAPKAGVPMIRMTRAQLRQFTEQKLNQSITPEQLRLEELVLKKFGLLPADYDLRKGVVDLVSEQAAALYDEKKKRMVMMDNGGNSELEKVALVHELAHALADQHFDLGRYLRFGSRELTDDEQMARAAVAEGQATWLMIEHSLSRMGQSLQSNPFVLDMVSRMGAAANASMPGLAEAPLYLREQMLFPYTQGAKFQQKVIEAKGLEGFRMPFVKAPVSTRQILHPEAYLADEPAPSFQLPDWKGPEGFRRTATGSMGEFDHLVLFLEFNQSEPKELAAGWRGGRFELWESGARSLIRYGSEWQTEEQAQKAMAAYLAILKKKWPDLQVKEESVERVYGQGAGGQFRLERQGTSVRAIEGEPIP